MSAEGLRAWQAGARASVLIAVVASAMLGMVAAACCLSWVAVGAFASVDDAAYVAVMAEALMHWDGGGLPTAWRCLVNGRVIGGAH